MNIKEFNADIKRDYKKAIGYPETYTYFGGAPVKVHVPIETPLNKVMIAGAYPSARFFTAEGPTGKVIDTPMEDHDSPFSNETYMSTSLTKENG